MYSSRYSCTSSSGHGAAAGTDRVQAAAPPEGKPLAREPHGWAARWLAGWLPAGRLAGWQGVAGLAGWLAGCLSVCRAHSEVFDIPDSDSCKLG